MIELRYVEAGTCPMVICDRCGEQITTGRGNVEWKLGDPEASFEEDPGTGFRIVHKPFECRVMETRAEANTWFLSQELTHFLVFLVANTGVDVTGARRSAEIVAGIGL